MNPTTAARLSTYQSQNLTEETFDNLTIKQMLVFYNDVAIHNEYPVIKSGSRKTVSTKLITLILLVK